MSQKSVNQKPEKNELIMLSEMKSIFEIGNRSFLKKEEDSIISGVSERNLCGLLNAAFNQLRAGECASARVEIRYRHHNFRWSRNCAINVSTF